MSRPATPLDAALAEAWLGLDELCRLAAVSPHWLRTHVDEGLLPGPTRPAGPIGPAGEPARWRVDAVLLRRVQRLHYFETHFDAAPELAALVADLHDEIEHLRARLRRAGLD